MIRNLSRALGRPADFLNPALKIRNLRALTGVTGLLIYELGCIPHTEIHNSPHKGIGVRDPWGITRAPWGIYRNYYRSYYVMCA